MSHMRFFTSFDLRGLKKKEIIGGDTPRKKKTKGNMESEYFFVPWKKEKTSRKTKTPSFFGGRAVSFEHGGVVDRKVVFRPVGSMGQWYIYSINYA